MLGVTANVGTSLNLSSKIGTSVNSSDSGKRGGSDRALGREARVGVLYGVSVMTLFKAFCPRTQPLFLTDTLMNFRERGKLS